VESQFDLMLQATLSSGNKGNLSIPIPHRKKEGISFQFSGLFLYTYIRQEAVLSSQIEGTQSSLSDLLRHELDGAPAAAKALAVTHPTATKAVRTLEKHGIVREMTGGDYRRLYIYHDYLAILGEEKAP
jgi:Fic family protein